MIGHPLHQVRCQGSSSRRRRELAAAGRASSDRGAMPWPPASVSWRPGVHGPNRSSWLPVLVCFPAFIETALTAPCGYDSALRLAATMASADSSPPLPVLNR
jgi:hypothetical protein